MRKVKIGIIGHGCRGYGLMDTMLLTDMYEFIMVCDKYEDRVASAQKQVFDKLGYEPKGTTDYHEVLANKDVEAVLVSCDWEMHLPIAIDAIKANKQPEFPFDIYNATTMSSVAILAHRSMLEGGKPYNIPDFSKKEDRDLWRNDRLTPFIGPNGEEPTLPCCSLTDFKPTEEQLNGYRDLRDNK